MAVGLNIVITSQSDFQRGTLSDVEATSGGDVQLIYSPNVVPDGSFEGQTLQPPYSSVQRGSISIVSGGTYGSYNLQHWASGSDSYTPDYFGDSDAALANASQGETWTASIDVLGASGGESAQIWIFALASDYSVAGASVNDCAVTTNWQRFSVTYTLPANTAYIATRIDNNTSGDTVYWENWQLEERSSATPFHDGDYVNPGAWYSQEFDLSPVEEILSTQVNWTETLNGQHSSFQAKVSTDGGSSWTNWTDCTNGGSIPGLTNGLDVSNGLLTIADTLWTDDIHVTPYLESVTLNIRATIPEKPLNINSVVSDRDLYSTAVQIRDLVLGESANTFSCDTDIALDKNLLLGEGIFSFCGGAIVLNKSIPLEATANTYHNFPELEASYAINQLVENRALDINRDFSLPLGYSIVTDIDSYINLVTNYMLGLSIDDLLELICPVDRPYTIGQSIEDRIANVESDRDFSYSLDYLMTTDIDSHINLETDYMLDLSIDILSEFTCSTSESYSMDQLIEILLENETALSTSYNLICNADDIFISGPWFIQAIKEKDWNKQGVFTHSWSKGGLKKSSWSKDSLKESNWNKQDLSTNDWIKH